GRAGPGRGPPRAVASPARARGGGPPAPFPSPPEARPPAPPLRAGGLPPHPGGRADERARLLVVERRRRLGGARQPARRLRQPAGAVQALPDPRVVRAGRAARQRRLRRADESAAA